MPKHTDRPRVKALGGGRYEIDIRYRDAANRRQRERVVRKCISRRAAEAWARQRAEHLWTYGGSPDVLVPTLAEFWPRFIADYVQANRHRPATVHSREMVYRNYLHPLLGDKRLDAITDADIARLKGALHNLAPVTINNGVFAVLRKVLRVAVEWKIIEAVPCTITDVVQDDREMAFYSEEDFERLVDAAKGLGWVYYVAVLLAGEAGLRAGEILALRWVDVRSASRQLRVEQSNWRGQVNATKGRRHRYVPMTKRLVEALREQIRGAEGSALVVTENGRSLTYDMLYDRILKAIRVAGLGEDERPVHRLRHTFGTRLASRGASAKAIQVVMGHRSITTTEKYMHLSPTRWDEVAWVLEEEKSRLGEDMGRDDR